VAPAPEAATLADALQDVLGPDVPAPAAETTRAASDTATFTPEERR
jgi:hypothetical protein